MPSEGISTPGQSPTETYRRVHGLLRKYLSELTASSLLDSSLERTSLSAMRLQIGDLTTLMPLLERGARLFMKSQRDAEDAIRELHKLIEEAGKRWAFPPEAPTATRLRTIVSEPIPSSSRRPKEEGINKGIPVLEQAPPLIVPIHREDDILKARVEARKLLERIGVSLTIQTHLATMVSELARNIILYADGQGAIDLTLLAPPQKGVGITARDRGPGITNLDLIFNGNYQSRQGMGLGLRGVRRLASFFEIKSTLGVGTTVHIQLKVE